jgi:hypothetical protein
MLNIVDWKVYAVVKSLKHAVKGKKGGKAGKDLHLDELVADLNVQLEKILKHLEERSEQKARIKNRRRHAEVEVVVKIEEV